MSALTSGRYHIKWTQLADLPVPLSCVLLALHSHKIYVTGQSLLEHAEHEVFVYDIIIDEWDQLPPSGQYRGIPYVIDGKLTIFGGRLSATKKMTNKVSTFDEDSQTWISYYPDLLSVRNKPGVVSHLEHVIVAGGGRPTAEDDNTPVVQDDIEVLNWIENSHWRKVSIKLPVPMWGFIPTISDDHLFIVGYNGVDGRYKNVYKISIADITVLVDLQHNSSTFANWTELTATDHYGTGQLQVPSSSPPVVVGGEKHVSEGSVPTADIKMYDNSNNSWKKIGSLSSARSSLAVAAVYNNAIVVIGGCTKGGGMPNAISSSLTVVELGQAVNYIS